jgi:hypothetical protein
MNFVFMGLSLAGGWSLYQENARIAGFLGFSAARIPAANSREPGYDAAGGRPAQRFRALADA